MSGRLSSMMFSRQTSSGSVISCRLWLNDISSGITGLTVFRYRKSILYSYFNDSQGWLTISLMPLYPSRFLDVLCSNYVTILIPY